MNTNHLENLYNQLPKFGLNKNDWKIKPLAAQLFEIYNNTDPEFKFRGEILNSSWKQIWLHSL